MSNGAPQTPQAQGLHLQRVDSVIGPFNRRGPIRERRTNAPTQISLMYPPQPHKNG
jgi:hypothetical protein